MSDERTPLLGNPAPGSSSRNNDLSWDHHVQFCQLIGTRPRNIPDDQDYKAHPESLYQRAVGHRRSQNIMYQFTATFTNVLLLSQVVIGAAITGLGASDSSHVIVTVFGALNTIIAGVVAFLKSRGQPMRARMFRDDLGRVVDEIENSAIMWLGISQGAHGYDAIDIDDEVTVRGEVARLTRLYDKAVKTNTLNDPDMYSTGAPGDPHSAALRAPTGQASAAPAPAPADPQTSAPAATPAPAAPAVDPDASPATEAPKPEAPADSKPAASTHSSSSIAGSSGKGTSTDAPTGKAGSTPAATASSSQTAATAGTAAPEASSSAAATAPSDPDESPATSAHPEKHSEDTSKADEDKK